MQYAESERFQRFQGTEILRRFDRLMDHMRAQNADVDDQELAQDVAAARSVPGSVVEVAE